MSNQPVIQVPLKLRSPEVPYRASVSSHAVLFPSSARPITAPDDGRRLTTMKRRERISGDLTCMLSAAKNPIDEISLVNQTTKPGETHNT